ncbi:MAG: carbamoyl-phosphate synthase large subunit [Deltaproteobacteria bacterium]|nr:carbamoyl-phosphate synthase large subunit [Deltaproteobacteria bacterium]
MPRRQDLRRILLLGSGPIVIGQACEFDYSGTQAAKALREEGFDVILVNSNPATIMTDPGLAARTYIEPLRPEVIEAIIAREKPDALLPTLGGQTALNLAVSLNAAGALERHSVELLGASVRSIETAEDRQEFKAAMERIGVETPGSGHVSSLVEAEELVRTIGFPAIIRPSFTLGGAGGSVAYNREELATAIHWGLRQSPRGQVLVEQSLLGWKEFELEVMRDGNDNFVVVCTIENLDPMGIHTGDSITVAPAMTLTDKEYQRMRDASRAIMREIGIACGGSNIQFAVEPSTGRQMVIEMNPRVSRSSALASKATGFPIAKVAAKLAVGYTLDEIQNDITMQTVVAFEPAIDYVVVKVPRFAFEKFPGADSRLTTQMKSVGEVMAIGKTFKQALGKALRALENGRDGLTPLRGKKDYRALKNRWSMLSDDALEQPPEPSDESLPPASEAELREALVELLRSPDGDRIWHLADAMRAGFSVEELNRITAIDPWFLTQLREVVELERSIAAGGMPGADLLRRCKEDGLSDSRIATLVGATPEEVKARRNELGVRPVYHRVDTCAAEFEARTPYLYSTYETSSESAPTSGRKVLILGGGPNRIGQGIEFDYCCVHAAFGLRELGIETIMLNCNPETVSTDYDTSDRLYFEPLTFEDVMAVVEEERPEGVIVQFGGQTPLKLALPLEKAGVRILGTSADAIDRAEDRGRFDQILTRLGLRRPRGGIALTVAESFTVAERIGYPVIVRPSYVLGGRAMEIVHERGDLQRYMRTAVDASEARPILVDEFLQDAIEIDVDAISDGHRVVIGGVMQHIEEAGVHSGDSSCVLPPHALPPDVLASIRSQTRAMALELGVVGLMNVQYAVRGSAVYVLEVNPRASRTVPFVSKAIGVPLAKLAVKVMAGETLEELGFVRDVVPKHVAVKESVFPFSKFPGVDTILGPEMRSTGEVMGLGSSFEPAFRKALDGGGMTMPTSGRVFVSVRDEDKPAACELALRLTELGFTIVATRGTAAALVRTGIQAELVHKVAEGRPHIVDRIKSGEIAMVLNTTVGRRAIRDSYSIRRQTLLSGIPYFTTIAAGAAAVGALEVGRAGQLDVRSLQEYQETKTP